MDQAKLLAQTTIEDLLDAHPQVSAVFIRRRMACVGCALAPFCTLADAARVYDVSLSSLVAECQDTINLPPDSAAGQTPSSGEDLWLPQPPKNAI